MTDASLLNLLPPLRRARGDRLYGAGQKHWVDLWKQDGAWLLGRRPEGAAKEWKIQLDKGLAGWAPSPWPRRLERLVERLIPGTAARVFRNADRAPDLPLWRPWAQSQPAGDAWRLVLPTGPGQAVAVAYGAGWSSPLPEHDITSPAEAAGLVRAVSEVLRLSADPRAVAERDAAAAAFDRHVAPTGLFRRSGIWFEAVTDDYPGLFRAFLAAGFLLNPDADAPGVIPRLSEGEWSAWNKAADAWREGSR
jgi:hypothetical protein